MIGPADPLVEFASWVPDPIAKELGTVMYRFEHVSGIDGLARTRGEGIEILAVVSNKTGSFREFIGRMKEVYSRVEVLEILNPKVDRILERYGFARGGRLNEFGAFCPSRVWKRGI